MCNLLQLPRLQNHLAISRKLGLGPSDGDRTLVEAGLAAGERVVVTGTYQVRLASLNTSEIGEGHVH